MIKVNLKLLVIKKGYKSIMQFAKKHKFSYVVLNKLANNQTKTIDKDLLFRLCEALDCQVGEIIEIKK